MRVSAKASLVATDAGHFVLLASTAGKDRDGDTLHLHEWQLPLPDRIPVNVDHDMSSNGVIGSGKPVITRRGLEIHGTFASDRKAQRIRSLMADGHLPGVSVEFLSKRHSDGSVSRELIGAGVVYTPANPEARVLSAKSLSDASASLTQAIHDASVHLGAQCVCVPDDPDDGSSEGANWGAGASSYTGSVSAKLLRMRLAALEAA